MRLIHLFVFVIVTTTISCNDGKKVGKPVIEVPATIADTLVPFQGTWVIASYIDTLLQTKSLVRSQGSEYFIRFPKSINDIAYSFVYHEGGQQSNVVKHGPSYFLKVVDNHSDSMEVSMLENGTKLKVGKDVFVKTNDTVGVAEQVLFAGAYKLGDKSVTFFENGQVEGLDSNRYFANQYDYIGPGYGNLDIILLGQSKPLKEEYCFEFIADTLFIYSTECIEQDADSVCLDLQRGLLKYKLIADKR